MGYFGWLVGLFNNNAILDMHEFNKFRDTKHILINYMK